MWTAPLRPISPSRRGYLSGLVSAANRILFGEVACTVVALRYLPNRATGSRKMLRRILAAVALSVLLAADPLVAQAQSTSEALQQITDTADKICGLVATSGNKSTAQATGEIKAELNGLIKRLADLGVSGGAEVSSSKYEGLLQQDLPTAMRDVIECKLKVFNVLQEKLITSNKQGDSASELEARLKRLEPRTISAEQQRQIKKFLQVPPGASYVMVVGSDGMCTDCYQYAIDFLGVLADAFWRREMIMVMAARGASPKGVAILTPDISAPLPEAVALANGLKAAGIPFDLNQGAELDPNGSAKWVAGLIITPKAAAYP
jgi:hypothetical protein